jgi:hypothetical protein
MISALCINRVSGFNFIMIRNVNMQVMQNHISCVPLFMCIIAALVLPFVLGCSIPTKKSEPCTYQHPDEGVITADNCISRDEAGRIIISANNVRNLHFNKDGLAAVRGEAEGWMYVNRSGEVVVAHVAAMDNGADDFHDGLVRIEKDNKWGFANIRGETVIPLIYDGALNFDNGAARVCSGCKAEPLPGGEIHVFRGGKWKRIDTMGRVLENRRP